MQAKPAVINAHRLARVIAWARCVVLWLRAVFGGRAELIARRLDLLDLDALTRAVSRLILARAAEITSFRARQAPCWRAPAPRGFRRHQAKTLRAAIGSRLRRVLKRGHDDERLACLLAALAEIDAHARRLVRRLKCGLTRLRALVVCAPPVERVSSAGAAAPLFLDTS